MLTKTKTQPSPHTTRNVIYQIPCKDRNATYCGQTRRPIHVRLSEHQRFTNNSKSFTYTDLQYASAVAHHTHTTGHTIDFKSTHILSSLTKSSQLDLIEYAPIKIICPSLNKLHSAPNIKARGGGVEGLKMPYFDFSICYRAGRDVPNAKNWRLI